MLRVVAAPGAAAEPRSSPTSATPASRAVLDRLADWPGTILAYALVDQAPQRLAGTPRASAERYPTANSPATALLGRVAATDPDSTTLEVYGLDPLAGPIHGPSFDRGPPQRRERAGRRRRAAVLGLDTGRIATELARSAGIGRRLERKGEAAGVVVYDDYGHHPTAIRETLAAVRQREPGRPRLGRLRAIDLPSDRGHARPVRRRPGRGRRGCDRRRLGRPRPRYDDRLGRRAGRRGRGPSPDDPGLRARRSSMPPRPAGRAT